MPSNMTKHESKAITALRRSVLFHGLPLAALARLAAESTAVNLPRGKHLHRSGGRPPGVYAVISGCFMLKAGTAVNSGKVIDLVAAGGHLCLAAVVLGTLETMSAEALADSTLLLIPRSALLECAADTPQLALQLAKALGQQVQSLIADIEGFSLHTGRERVADYLLQLAGSNGTQSSPFALPAKKSVIASRLSLTPEYFSRTLHDLILTGAIAVNGRQVTVLNSARLRQRDA